MNLRKLKNQAGFTLVELIVVIAIMAILAGVAVPVYSGYIEKAEKAGDLQLLGAVNSAFGAACIENDTDVHSVVEDVGTPSITNYEDIAVSMFDDEFQVYFAGNEGGFKVIKQLLFVNGAFVDPTSGAVEGVTAMEYAGVTLYFSDAQLEVLKNGNTFMTANGLGAQGLLDKVNDVTDFAAVMDSTAMGQVLTSAEFTNMAASILGLDTKDPDLQNKLIAEMNTLAQKMVENGDATSTDEAVKKVQANAAVLLAAQSTTKQNPEDIKTLLTGDDVKGDILNTLKTDKGTALSQAAVAYGMYTAYAYSTGDATLIEKTKDPQDILNGLQDEGFQNYMNTEQANKDLDAYMSAMSMVNGSTGDKAAASEVLVNGFNDPALVALLQQAMASGQ